MSIFPFKRHSSEEHQKMTAALDDFGQGWSINKTIKDIGEHNRPADRERLARMLATYAFCEGWRAAGGSKE